MKGVLQDYISSDVFKSDGLWVLSVFRKPYLLLYGVFMCLSVCLTVSLFVSM